MKLLSIFGLGLAMAVGATSVVKPIKDSDPLGGRDVQGACVSATTITITETVCVSAPSGLPVSPTDSYSPPPVVATSSATASTGRESPFPPGSVPSLPTPVVTTPPANSTASTSEFVAGSSSEGVSTPMSTSSTTPVSHSNTSTQPSPTSPTGNSAPGVSNGSIGSALVLGGLFLNAVIGLAA